MEKPPSTFEEFLNFRHLKNWPENSFLEENLPGVLFSANNFSLEIINEEFLRKVPFNSDVFEDLEAEIAKDLTFLDSYSSQIIYLPTSEDHLCSVNRAFVTEVEFHELSQKAQDKIEALSRINYGKENFVENCVFPDFSGADLPGYLEATQILQCIAKTKQYQDLHGKMLSKFLLSEESVAMLKDCFWWFFLHRFKPQQLAQDHLFDRLSDTFVALFCRVPTDVKDFFFKMYPNYLSQAVFTAFYKAFPQSLPQFNGEFKSEIVDLIFQWVSGIKPVPCSWKKWDLHFLDKSDQFSKGNITLPLENQPNGYPMKLTFISLAYTLSD